MLQRLPANRVAILLSTFNGERFLQEQLDSLLAQDFEEWTLYWRDDGSTDGTIAILDEFARTAGQGRCVRVQLTEDRLRPTASFLALLAAVQDRLAEGDMVAFADQDDVWLPQKILRAVDALRPVANETPALYCARQMLVDDNLREMGISAPLNRPAGFPAALTQNVTTGCTIVLNQRAARLVGSSKPSSSTLHDWWCYLVVSAAGGQIIHDDTPTVLYRQHTTNMVGAPHSMTRRAVAALRRGPGVFMNVLREHIEALRAQPYLLSPEARRQVEKLDGALKAGPLRRLAVLPMPGLRRQTFAEMCGFWVWFLLG